MCCVSDVWYVQSGHCGVDMWWGLFCWDKNLGKVICWLVIVRLFCVFCMEMFVQSRVWAVMGCLVNCCVVLINCFVRCVCMVF